MSAPNPEEMSAFMLTALRIFGSTADPQCRLTASLKTGQTLVVTVHTIPPADEVPDNLIPFPHGPNHPKV